MIAIHRLRTSGLAGLGNALASALWALTILLAAFAAGCRQDRPAPPPPPVRVSGVIPPPGEPYKGSLTVVFDGPIRPAREAAVKDTSTTAGMVFWPPLSGTVHFGPNYLSLLGGDTLDARTLLETRLTGAVESAAGRPIAGSTTITLTGFQFAPTMVFLNDVTSTRTQLGLTFNAEVRPGDAAKFVQLQDDSRTTIPIAFTSGTNARTVLMDAPRRGPQPRWVVSKKGLPEAGGRFRLERDVRLSASSAPPLRISSSSWWETGRERQTVRLDFSGIVDLSALRAKMRVVDLGTTDSKPLAFDLRYLVPNRQDVLVSFVAPKPQDVKVRLTIAAGLEDSIGSALLDTFSTEQAVRTELLTQSQNWITETSGLSLSVYFNYPIQLNEVKSRISFDPPVPGMTVTQENGSEYRFGGRFELATRYRMRLAEGVHFAGWAILEHPVTLLMTSPERIAPSLDLPNIDAYYQPRRYGDIVPVESRGYDALQARLYRMFPGNIAVAAEEIDRSGRVGWEMPSRWSELVGERRFDLKKDDLGSISTPLNLDRMTSAPLRGVYTLQVQGVAAANYIETETRLVLMTNLGLLAQWQDDEIAIFAHNLFTLAPAEDARVSIYSEKNQLLGRAQTDSRGIARLRGFKAQLGTPYVAVVEAGDDYTFLRLINQREERLPIDNNSLSPYGAENYDAFCYADRELYRPGETVHLNWLARSGYGDALSSAPLTLEIFKPNGKSLVKQTIPLSRWGTGGFNLATQKAYPTGRYQARLSIPGSDKVLGEYGFQLEEFVPNRMKAALKLDDPLWIAGKAPFRITLAASHLFGGPASDRVATSVVSFALGFNFKVFPGYRFGNDEGNTLDAAPLGEATTDAAGNAVFNFSGRPGKFDSQPIPARVAGRVREIGGREVNAPAVSAVWFPSDVCLGVKLEPTTGGQVLAMAAAVRPDGQPADLPQVRIKLEHALWNYNVRSYYTHHEASFSSQFELVEDRPTTLTAGIGRTVFAAPDYGRYKVTVYSPGNAQFSTMYFFTYGGQAQVSATAEPGLIRLNLEKDRLSVGETARVRIQSPFDGKCILVVQGEHIQSVIEVPIRNGAGTAELKIKPEWYPNVWIEATAIHPVEDDKEQVYPLSSFAMAGLRVDDPRRKIAVSFPGLPIETHPAGKFDVVVQTRDANGRPAPSLVTLAAVDEGIHGITGYETPDPLAWFNRLRRPQFNYAHYYDRIADKWVPPAAGGDSGEVEQRLGRLGMNWIQTVALWSGEVNTGANGRATVALDIPEFSGQLRLVAIAADATACGSASAELYVRRPWMLEASLPRYLLPGDSARILATLYNTSATSISAQMSLATSGTLTQTDPTSGTRRLAIAPRGEKTIAAELRAADAPGDGLAIWTAMIEDGAGAALQTLKQSLPLPVGEPAAWEERHSLRVVAPGESAVIDSSDFVQDGLAGLSIAVGADPMLRLENALHCVVGYPYGCVEQTTSRLLGLYLLRKSRALSAETSGTVGDLNLYIRSGIDRLFSMQTASGGLAFWPGSNTPYPYGSIYAFHFLTLAKAGHELAIDNDDYEALRRYVRQLALDPEDESSSGLYQRAYAVYALALGGDRQAVEMIARFEGARMPRSARLWLGAALAINTRDYDRVRLFMNAAPTVAFDEREMDGTLNSPLRNTAVELLAQVEMNSDPSEMLRTAEALGRDLEDRHYLTTQEQAFIIAALCRYFDRVAPNVGKAAGTIEWSGGSAPAEGTGAIAGEQVFRRAIKGPGVKFTVINTGPAALYVDAVASGVPVHPVAGPTAEGVALGRRILDRNGSPVDPAHLRQGASYVVELTIDARRELKHFVIADLLPAGLEVQNPRLSPDTQAGIKLQEAPVNPSHLELRDDRLVIVFGKLAKSGPSNPYHFYYVADAVTPGQFRQPAAVGECMYDPATRGSTAGGTITVEAP